MNEQIKAQKDKSRILRERAKALAVELKGKEGLDELLEIVEFRLAQERYAIETAYVREVYPLEDLTPLPCTPAFVLGLVNVRGRILPVIDLKKFFDLPPEGITDLHRILLVKSAEMEFGILADTIVGVRRIPVGAIQPSVPTLTGIRAEYLKGVTAEHLVILDITKMLADPKIVVHEEVGS